LIALAIALPLTFGSVGGSYDIFFHLATGRWMWEHGFPKVDPFSVTARGAHFPHEWGFSLLAALSERVFGAAGPLLLTACLVAACALLLWRAMGRGGEVGLVDLVLLELALGCQAFTWEEERPFHFGHVFFAASLLAVQQWRRGSARAAWLLVPLVALWANLHGSWVIAPVLLASAAVGHFLDARFFAPAPGEQRRALWALATAAAAFLAAALSPEGPRTCLYPFQVTALSTTKAIAEWKPLSMELHYAQALLVLALLVAFAARTAWRGRLALLLPAAGLLLATLGASRHATYAGMALAVCGADLLRGQALPAAVRGIDEWIRSWAKAASGAALPFAALSVVAIASAVHPQLVRDRLALNEYPLEALDALAKLPPGRVFNLYRWGGAVSYFAGESHKVFIDPRNDPFPPEIHRAYQTIGATLPGWQKKLEAYDPDYLLWRWDDLGFTLLRELARQGGWRRVVDEPDQVLWVRDRSAPVPSR
jgi:hypothetical protein